MNPVRRIAARVARGADRIAFPPAASAHEHWQRVVMNEAVEARIAALGPESLRAAEISGDLHASKPWKEYVALAWPDFDICAPLTEERRFDLVICEQVLEHVPDPCAAVDNLRALCAPGGRVIVSTPFLIKVHEFPSYGMLDYWRFTPRGLRTLLEARRARDRERRFVGQPPVRGRELQRLVGASAMAFAARRARLSGPGLGGRAAPGVSQTAPEPLLRFRPSPSFVASANPAPPP